MLTAEKFEFVKTTLNNWEALGTPSVPRAGEKYGELFSEIRQALQGGASDAAEVAARIGDKIPDDLRKSVGRIREQAGPSPNELGKLQAQLDDTHAAVLEGVVNGHDVGLPKLSEPWTDEVFIAWMVHIPEMPEPMLSLMINIKKWWKQVGNFLT